MLTIVQYFYIFFIRLFVIPCYCITVAMLFKLLLANPVLTAIENIPLGK